MLDYVRLLEANNAIQSIGDDTYWLCVTRTVQESKLFPVPSYMLMSYLCCYYRYPELLRKIESTVSAEELGDRSRAIGGKLGSLPGWGLPTFYLIGREILINFGMLTPADNAEDVAYVMDFWRRFKLAQQREDGHLNAREFGQRVQLLPQRRIQRFHADLLRCKTGDPLHGAAQAFLAAVSQYGFLVSCESRCTLNNSGPYKLGEDREMIVREFTDLSRGDYPWLDGIGDVIPYNNLTVTMEATGCHFYLMDDWGSFESKPEFTAEALTGVGLYTSDALSDGFEPVGMGSVEELTATFEDLTEKVRTATVELWKKMAGWTRDQMMDAGAIVYFSLIKDLAHLAGVYEADDWMKIDPRADRFRNLFNDQFGRDFLGEMVGLVSLPSQQLHEYAMMRHTNQPRRYLSHIPYSVLDGAPQAERLEPIGEGVLHFAEKQGTYRTTRGMLELAEYNRCAAEMAPLQMEPGMRFLCDTAIKWAPPGDAAVERITRDEWRNSEVLRDAPVNLTREEIERRRR
ncbi:hypothetical protein [Novosphingobium mangrovi (ex Huang et al. 2023)]|uniref:Uncharacterized protein n=1 Tax=Novosphingobium mangrovi (ex Huang et al. 2023) TaxID=2976432 RepID=A0ABT2I3D3_9SPHN|nr:hypothetical protein [Novosphingobium mangrovi (ex Huang et al. 2023)]MCT2399314.1 hypothetical protein [Novosphingobium mangrovi (ex Huang et al. 2023)]